MSYFVYILICSDNSYYVGFCSDLDRRLNEHNSGRGACYTRIRRPVSLVFKEEFNEKAMAKAREKQIKGWTREKKEALMKGIIKTKSK